MTRPVTVPAANAVTCSDAFSAPSRRSSRSRISNYLAGWWLGKIWINSPDGTVDMRIFPEQGGDR